MVTPIIRRIKREKFKLFQTQVHLPFTDSHFCPSIYVNSISGCRLKPSQFRLSLIWVGDIFSHRNHTRRVMTWHWRGVAGGSVTA